MSPGSEGQEKLVGHGVLFCGNIIKVEITQLFMYTWLSKRDILINK